MLISATSLHVCLVISACMVVHWWDHPVLYLKRKSSFKGNGLIYTDMPLVPCLLSIIIIIIMFINIIQHKLNDLVLFIHEYSTLSLTN